MGRVLADVAAYKEEPHRLIFTCLFSLSILCVSSYVELCTTYPVVLTVVQRRNIAMVLSLVGHNAHVFSLSTHSEQNH
jgi:hypothetical protein